MEHTERPCTLSALHRGQSGVVCTLTAAGAMRRRLQDLGLICGTKVTCVGVSPLGDPKAFRVRGAVIALRRSDADTVHILIQ